MIDFDKCQHAEKTGLALPGQNAYARCISCRVQGDNQLWRALESSQAEAKALREALETLIKETDDTMRYDVDPAALWPEIVKRARAALESLPGQPRT